MGTVRRVRAVLGLKKDNYPHLLGRAKAINNGVAANPTLFAAPNPPLATLDGKIQELDHAQQIAGTRAKGSAAVRNMKAAEVITLLEIMKTYVQATVDANPEQGQALIEAASMTVGQVTTYSKPVLQARQSAPSSPVEVVANVGVLTADMRGKVFFNWQSSSDGGQTWTAAPSTPHGRTELEGLTPMEIHAFRVSVTNGRGPGEWSQAVALLVR